MKQIDLNVLLDEEKEILLGNKHILIPNLSAMRAIKATKMYQDVYKSVEKEIHRRLKNKKYKEIFIKLSDEQRTISILSEYRFARRYMYQLIKVCLFIIRQRSLVARFLNYVKGNGITKKWLLRNTNDKQINRFLEEALEIKKKTEMTIT